MLSDQNMTEADLRAEAEHWLNIYRQRHKHVGCFEAGLGWDKKVVANAQRQAKIYISCHIWQPAGTDSHSAQTSQQKSQRAEHYFGKVYMHAQFLCKMHASIVNHAHAQSQCFVWPCT